MRRMEWMAIAWGGVIAGIGLIVAADDPGPVRVGVAIVLFGLAGFLAGVRAEDRRLLHAILGAVVAVAFLCLFVLATWAVQAFGGPGRAGFIPGGRDGWRWHPAAFLAAAVVGGAFATYRLRPQGDQRARRRYPEG